MKAFRGSHTITLIFVPNFPQQPTDRRGLMCHHYSFGRWYYCILISKKKKVVVCKSDRSIKTPAQNCILLQSFIKRGLEGEAFAWGRTKSGMKPPPPPLKLNIYHTLKCSFLCFKWNSVSPETSWLCCCFCPHWNSLSSHLSSRWWGFKRRTKQFPWGQGKAREQPKPPTNQETGIA